MLPPAIRRMGEGNSFSLFTSGGGGTPSQVQVGGAGYSISGPGRGGTPSQVGGYPSRGGYPSQGGVPQLGGGVTPGTPPRIASTCYGYAAGGMPLAFTQEDFLVSIVFNEMNITKALFTCSVCACVCIKTSTLREWKTLVMGSHPFSVWHLRHH